MRCQVQFCHISVNKMFVKTFQEFYVYCVHHTSFSTIQQTNAHKCHLVQNNIYINTKLLHAMHVTGPPPAIH